MSLSRIGKRYAKALLELAEEKNAVEEVKSDMDDFHMICQDKKDFVGFLKSPIINHLKKAEILDQMFKGKVHQITHQIFSILTRKNREKILPNVAEEFINYYNSQKGLAKATVTTTFPLDGGMKKEIEKIIKTVTGKQPILTEKVDPAIVGGYVLTVGDKQIDESLHSKLRDLKLRFKQKSNI